MGEKYLIYVDILGFKKKAAEIAEKTGFEIARDQKILELILICPEIRTMYCDGTAGGAESLRPIYSHGGIVWN